MNLDDEELFYTRLLNGKASIKEIEEYIKKLKRQINIKNEYLELIYDLGYDYDGCNTIKSLKKLIDELIDLAAKAIKNDDKAVMFMGGKNILCEEVGEDNEYILTQKEDDYIPKFLVRDLLKELNNEYIKQEEIFNKHFEKENRDMQDYYIQKEATNIMQEISWLEGKIEELLEGDK